MSIRRDILAGFITGLTAIPLSAGICIMSNYPIKIGLITVVFACFVGFITSLFKAGNFVGVPGVAAGLAPILASGVNQFGMENMPFIIFLTSIIQMIVWKYKWENFILQIVPSYLVEGLLAGIGIKIALKFLPYTYQTTNIIALSFASGILFFFLFNKFKTTKPGIPYILIIAISIISAKFIPVPMLRIDNIPFQVKLPLPNFDFTDYSMILNVLIFAFVLAVIDVIEQVMSNVAIGKLDSQKRPVNSNNSLLAIWIANLGSSFFGGMTNLDGLAKSTTNATAGAVTKFSNLITGLVLLFFVFNHQYLKYLPEYSLAVLMIFSGWKMFAGLFHVYSEGKYAFILSLCCCVLVWQFGIFEGLLLSLLIQKLISFFIKSSHKN